MKLNRYKCDNTGLTAKEREEIAKLSKEIMDQPAEELEWPDGLSIVLEVGGPKLRESLTRAFGLEVSSKENTTTENSDVDLSKTSSVRINQSGIQIKNQR